VIVFGGKKKVAKNVVQEKKEKKNACTKISQLFI
jgi:hypothetical protein